MRGEENTFIMGELLGMGPFLEREGFLWAENGRKCHRRSHRHRKQNYGKAHFVMGGQNDGHQKIQVTLYDMQRMPIATLQPRNRSFPYY